MFRNESMLIGASGKQLQDFQLFCLSRLLMEY